MSKYLLVAIAAVSQISFGQTATPANTVAIQKMPSGLVMFKRCEPSGQACVDISSSQFDQQRLKTYVQNSYRWNHQLPTNAGSPKDWAYAGGGCLIGAIVGGAMAGPPGAGALCGAGGLFGTTGSMADGTYNGDIIFGNERLYSYLGAYNNGDFEIVAKGPVTDFELQRIAIALQNFKTHAFYDVVGRSNKALRIANGIIDEVYSPSPRVDKVNTLLQDMDALLYENQYYEQPFSMDVLSRLGDARAKAEAFLSRTATVSQ